MKLIRTIARREFLAILCSPAGLALLGLYLGVSGYIFSLNVSVTHEATLRHTFSSLATLTIFIVPLLTMRLLAEELRSGTFELLTAHPVTDFQIAMGKFLAGWLAYVVLSSPTLIYLAILKAFGSPDLGPSLCGYVGLQLLAAMLTALGLLVSALTSSQVLAAMGAMVGGVLLWMAGTASISVSGRLSKALQYLAMLDHFSTFRRGVVDTRSVVYFLATTAMFLYLAVRAIESRRWKFGVAPGEAPAAWRRPWLSIGLLAAALAFVGEAAITRVAWGTWTPYNSMFTALAIALGGAAAFLNRRRLRHEVARRQAGVALIVAVNCLLVVVIWLLATFMASQHYVRLDLTSTKRYALSEQTKTVLGRLAGPVNLVVAVSQPSDLRQEVADLLAEYTARCPRLSVQYVDPRRNPGELEQIRQRYSLSSPLSEEILATAGERSRRIPVGSLINQPVQVIGDRRVAGPTRFVGEAEITAALIQLTREKPGRIAFLSGHGERDPGEAGNDGASFCAAELRRNGWVVDKHVVTPGANAEFPSDTSVVVVAGPKKKLANEDLKALQSVLDRSGGALFLLDPGVDAGLEPFLGPWNVRLGNDLVVDLQDHLATTDPTSLYVTQFRTDSPIGKGMGPLSAVLPAARRVAVALSGINPNVFTNNFMHTSGNSWAISYQAGNKLNIDTKRDKQGPISLGMTCERFQESAEPGKNPLLGRVVVIGDSDFAANQYADMSGNLDLFLNCIDWLAGRQDLISVRPKVSDVRRLTLTARQAKAVFWFSVLFVPAGAVLTGWAAIVRRRRNA